MISPLTSKDILIREWLAAKEKERLAVEERREIEDALTNALKIDQTQDKSQSINIDGYKVKVTTRLTRKIDAERLQIVAAESGLTEHLSNLFRWKPEINSSAWKNADEKITKPLLAAIETKPGRPSYSIEEI